MQKVLAIVAMWILGAPIYLPWLLARLGLYKRWYFAPFMPPFSWRGWIQLWPISAFFVFTPCIALLPIGDDLFITVIAGIGISGVIIALVLVLWTPSWAKPTWQRRLEDRYSHEEISRFIQVWRGMDFKEWSRLIETEEGTKTLVRMARGNSYEEEG